MDVLDLDLAEFEDPAPLVGGEPTIKEKENEQNNRALKKKKLPFRASIELSAKKYRGKKTSRQDVELDAGTLGINEKPEDVSDIQVDYSEEEVDENDDEGNEALNLKDEANEDADESDADEPVRSDSPDKESTVFRKNNINDDEQAVLNRLRSVEREEENQANGVRKQKELYDAVVNFRIRLEALMSLARTFPTQKDRENPSAMWTEDEIKEELTNVQRTLTDLENHTKESWSQTWPQEEDEDSDKEFEKWRDSVLDTWGQKVDEASGFIPKGGFKAFDTSVTAQMKASLASGKHLNRTRRVKENIEMLGGSELSEGLHEIHFDDGELYRMLLREIIESGDGAAGGLKYAQISKGGKVRKKAHRRFAKGKKLKYDVHEKLVGFLAPVPLPDPGPLDEIVASLFGKRKGIKAV